MGREIWTSCVGVSNKSVLYLFTKEGGGLDCTFETSPFIELICFYEYQSTEFSA